MPDQVKTCRLLVLLPTKRFWMGGYLSCIYGGDAESSFRHSNGWPYESDVKLSEGDVGRWRLISNSPSQHPVAMPGGLEYR